MHMRLYNTPESWNLQPLDCDYLIHKDQMTPANQMYSVLTRRIWPLDRLSSWGLLLSLGIVVIGVARAPMALETSASEDATRPAAYFEGLDDGLALANARLKEPLPKGAREEVEAMVEIAWRESRFDPKMQSPTSTSSGLFGFLDSTYRNYGGKTHDPMGQTRMALRYVADRYGSPRKALAQHRRHGWY